MALNLMAHVERILDGIDRVSNRFLDAVHRVRHRIGGGVDRRRDLLLQRFQFVLQRRSGFFHLVVDHLRFAIHCTSSFRACIDSLGSVVKDANKSLPT